MCVGCFQRLRRERVLCSLNRHFGVHRHTQSAGSGGIRVIRKDNKAQGQSKCWTNQPEQQGCTERSNASIDASRSSCSKHVVCDSRDFKANREIDIFIQASTYMQSGKNSEPWDKGVTRIQNRADQREGNRPGHPQCALSGRPHHRQPPTRPSSPRASPSTPSSPPSSRSSPPAPSSSPRSSSPLHSASRPPSPPSRAAARLSPAP